MSVDRKFVQRVLQLMPNNGLDLVLKFKPEDSAEAMNALFLADRHGALSIHEADIVLAMRLETEKPPPERVRVHLPSQSNRDCVQLLERLTAYLLDIEVADQHTFEGLQTKHPRKRGEEAQRIVEELLTQQAKDELDDWGMHTLHSVVEEEDFFLLKLEIVVADQVALTYYFDGWSGLMRSGERWCTLHSQVTPQVFENHLIRDVQGYLLLATEPQAAAN